MYAVSNSGIKRPKILTADKTLATIIATDKSLVRFGDGKIPFQKLILVETKQAFDSYVCDIFDLHKRISL